MTSPPGDVAKVSVFVRVAPADAFEVFTQEIDAWWRTGPRYRVAGRRRGKLFFEPGPTGRVYETFEVASGGTRTFEVGKVLAWEPPSRLELEWRIANLGLAPQPPAAEEKTFVEVSFVPQNDGTLVTVRHYGWSAIRADHPARHGLEVAAFIREMGLWWGGLMTSLREHVDERGA